MQAKSSARAPSNKPLPLPELQYDLSPKDLGRATRSRERVVTLLPMEATDSGELAGLRPSSALDDPYSPSTSFTHPQQALDAPRWFLHGAGISQAECDMRQSHLQLEDGFGGRWDGQQQHHGGAEAGAEGEAAVVAGLIARGHDVLDIVRGSDRKIFGWGHIILRDPATGVLWAGSEPRCDGCAIPAIL